MRPKCVEAFGLRVFPGVGLNPLNLLTLSLFNPIDSHYMECRRKVPFKRINCSTAAHVGFNQRFPTAIFGMIPRIPE